MRAAYLTPFAFAVGWLVSAAQAADGPAAWPLTVCLIAGTIVLFVSGYVVFQRQ
jgi:hypothetical protein